MSDPIPDLSVNDEADIPAEDPTPAESFPLPWRAMEALDRGHAGLRPGACDGIIQAD